MINARGEMHSYWYGGTREGAEDVAIYGARFDRLTSTWVDHRRIIDRVSASEQSNRWVRKIGNPVAFGHPDGRVWLFYVNVSVGGWAWSAINLATSNDGGMTFGGDKRLVTSPFFNRSTLVKSPALELPDGTIGLPVHHQLLSKHGEMLKLNNDGAVIDKRRIPSKLPALQPALVKMPDGSLLAFLRNGAEDQRMLLRSTSHNWGLSWSSATNADIPNPNSAVAVTFTPGGLLLAFNNDPKNRDVLSLAHSTDEGKSWRILHVLEYQPNLHEHDHSNEFSYPWFVQDDNGFYHLFYTWQRTFIKHVQFNNAWLEQQLGVDG
jgi:predicted neuraminidase